MANNNQSLSAALNGSLELTLTNAAAAFKDADFFDSSILFWSAVLETTSFLLSPSSSSISPDVELRASLDVLANGLDLEQELDLDVQADEPIIDLVFPPDHLGSNIINAETILPIQTYIITALCYLSRQINIRIDILPSGQDTLTSLGPPQRYYLSLNSPQKHLYHNILAIIFATNASIAINTRRSLVVQRSHKNETLLAWERQVQIQQTTLLGNSSISSSWQATLWPQKKTPHNMPRFFSYLNVTHSCSVAGCSIPRNEQDIDALEQAGFRLVITLIRESPLSPTWFHHQSSHGQQQQKRDEQISPTSVPKLIRNAFVPVENRKAPGFPEVFEVLMGWCIRTGCATTTTTTADMADGVEIPNPELLTPPEYPHQRATLIHCGGGKGRAGIVLAAYLIRFGALGHEAHGYCTECIKHNNVHPYDLDYFRKGLGNQETVAATLPGKCCSFLLEEDENDDELESLKEWTFVGYSVQRSECLNRFQPMMTAKDAIAYLRELRPGSIESVEQEKAVKAYGDWLWRQSSSRSARSSSSRGTNISSSSDITVSDHDHVPGVGQGDGGGLDSKSESNTTTSVTTKAKKEAKRDHPPKPKPSSSSTPPVNAAAGAEDEGDELSDDDYARGGRKPGKKGKKGPRKISLEPAHTFVPPPPEKIIKIPGSQHHQHHLIVQHNMRARQLQRGQKSKKNGGGSGGHGKNSKERPSFHISGAPLVSAPKLVILVGLPGSGKSHLVTTLMQGFPEHFERISQDELGSRAVCERLLAQNMRRQQQSLAVRGPGKALPMTVFIDRCNPTMAERKEWYELAFQPDETAMVWFSRNIEQCIKRVDSRENHPTVEAGKGDKVVRSFAKGFEFPNLNKEGNWCKTLVEVGDDEGIDQLLQIMKKFAADAPAKLRTSTNGVETKLAIKTRPAFIPTKALQRKSNGTAATVVSMATTFSTISSLTSPESGDAKVLSPVSMESVEEEDEDVEEDDNHGNGGYDGFTHESKSHNLREAGKAGGDANDQKEDSNPQFSSQILLPDVSFLDLSSSKALRFASLTGHRPAVKKPIKGNWKSPSVDTTILSTNQIQSQGQESASPRGVSFATPLINYDRPMQKYPRTPHLFDPLTIRQSLAQKTDHIADLFLSPSVVASEEKNSAISRSDLLLPPSALYQYFVPKPHQVLTVEEKMDGANIGFSVVHFKTMNGFAGITAPGPPPKIRVQNRNHFVHPDDHWQFKKLNSWLDKHREDILYLCEGRWRFDDNDPRGNKEQGVEAEEEREDSESEDEASEHSNVYDRTSSASAGDVTNGDDDGSWEDEEDEDENEYVDEDRVLQDGLAPYVLYGEWLYAKHSVEYTGLKSWFVPFDLYDVKTGTFVSRKLFRSAVAKTQLTLNPIIQIPEDVYGDVKKTLQWTIEMLQSRSALMRRSEQEKEEEEKKVDQTSVCTQAKRQQERVEGLYFRVDQNDRLLMRSKVVRPDFIAGEERWGTKEQVANLLLWHEETLPRYDEES
ncbi:hypothetical protein BX616_003274 [Lobosporangium transversale]|nr:hypothetical protein BX616_003274 [Lobosporangium transversale]